MATKIVMMLLGLSLILAVACGGAPAAPETTAAPAVEPTAAPVESATSQPTATLQVAAPPTDVEVNPGKLTIMEGDLGNERFDWLWGTGAGSRTYSRIVHGYLISIDSRRTELVPGIASDWSLSADGLTWTFTIRRGVKWHDGSELTAQDVLWTFQHDFGPQAPEYASQTTALKLAGLTDEIKLTEPDKVSLTTKVPVTEMADNLSEGCNNCIMSVLPKRAKVHDLEEEAAYDSNPIGAGIMRLVSHVPAYVMSFERFDDFYYQPANGFPEDKRVNFQSLDLFLVPEESSRAAAIRAGEADIATASLGVKQQVEAGGGRLVFVQEGNVIEVMWVNCQQPQYRCQDKRVRQALDYAIDKELIRDRLYSPEIFNVKGWGPVTPSTIGYTPELDPRPFDPDKARQLLAEAGYKTPTYPSGKEFGKLILVTPPSSPLPYTVEGAQLVADFWKRELGLDVELNVIDSTGITKKRDAGDLNDQVYWYPNEARIDTTSFINRRYGSTPAEYFPVLHVDQEVRALVVEAVGILDPDERAAAYKKLFPRLREEAYELTVGYANTPWAVGPRILTWEPYPLVAHPSALHTITLK